MRKILCEERDALLLDKSTGLVSAVWSVGATLTDPAGEFGSPRIETTWESGAVRVLDVRHPDPAGGADLWPCEHFLFTDGEDKDND